VKNTNESLILECEHIHNKVLFDCINEILDKYRPYGKEGFPLPWSTRSRKLGTSDLINFERIFDGIKSDVTLKLLINSCINGQACSPAPYPDQISFLTMPLMTNSSMKSEKSALPPFWLLM
jgi:hypothetical protein